MAKKLILVWLTLLMVLFSSISIYADENVQGDFFVKHVVVNGEEIINYNLQYPFILYGSTLYIPLTDGIGEICGFDAAVDWESHTLKLLKTDSTKKNISSNWMKNDNVDLLCTVVEDMTILAYGKASGSAVTSDAAVTAAAIEKSEGEMTNVDEATESRIQLAENTPVLYAGGYLYLPLRAFTGGEQFNWDIYFDPYYGVCISTDPGVPASGYVDSAELLRNRGYVNYIMQANATVPASLAQNYVFFFKRAAYLYGIDEQLLMSIARRESHFGYNCGNYSPTKAAGMMQILPSTGARWGLSLEDLYDPYKNIMFGAQYVSERINAYDGNWTLGLSAYNQGSSKVNRGSYSTTYATKVLETYNTISNYLVQNGFVQ